MYLYNRKTKDLVHEKTFTILLILTSVISFSQKEETKCSLFENKLIQSK
jgi:hypothetical protein